MDVFKKSWSQPEKFSKLMWVIFWHIFKEQMGSVCRPWLYILRLVNEIVNLYVEDEKAVQQSCKVCGSSIRTTSIVFSFYIGVPDISNSND